MSNFLGDSWDWLKGHLNPITDVKDIYGAIKGGVGDVTNALEGDPGQVASALQGLSNTAYQQGNQIKNFLLGREANAEQYYKPMQQMFGTMYGSGGIMPAKAPGVPGSGPIGGSGSGY